MMSQEKEGLAKHWDLKTLGLVVGLVLMIISWGVTWGATSNRLQQVERLAIQNAAKIELLQETITSVRVSLARIEGDVTYIRKELERSRP